MVSNFWNWIKPISSLLALSDFWIEYLAPFIDSPPYLFLHFLFLSDRIRRQLSEVEGKEIIFNFPASCYCKLGLLV